MSVLVVGGVIINKHEPHTQDINTGGMVMQALAIQTMNPANIKNMVASKMDSAAFASWIAPCEFSVKNNTLVITAPNQFSVSFIKSVYLNVLESFDMPIEIVAVGNTNATANDNEVKTFIPNTNTNAEYRFDNFITSDENAFAVSAAKKISSGTATFSPLFIYGGTGCGKSLLAGCIAATTTLRVVSMTGGQFLSEFARALRDNSVFAFKDFCRKCDVFIMDDVHVLSGKRATCEEFLNLLTDLISQNKNIVLTSNAAPAALSGFDRRAQSIMASGLVADLTAPDAGVRRQMLMNSGVDDGVATTLSVRVGADGHLVAGVAKKIAAYTELMGERVTANIAERLLSDTVRRARTPVQMVKSMCDKLGVSYDAVCGAGRCRTIVRARMIMMSALKSGTKLSLSDIGNLVGGRDHASVLYAINTLEKLKKTDLILGAQLMQMIEECK